MRLRALLAVVLLGGTGCCLLGAQTSLNPGGSVTPATGIVRGSTIATVPGSSGGLSYTDSVYQDSGNPFCSTCLDFVIGVRNPDTGAISPTEGLSVTTSSFKGYSVDVAYGADGNVAPDGASRSADGSDVSFQFQLYPGDVTDALIVYTNATSYGRGSLDLTTTVIETDPPAYAPSGAPYVAATPEPSSLLMFGTGLLGAVGVVRRRLT